MRAAAAAVLVLVLALPAWGAEPRPASLKLRSLAPLVVNGRGFGEQEHVVLVAAVPGTQRIVNAIAGRNGSFSIRFTLRLERCTALTVRAIGELGSRAILQRAPDCRERRERRRGRG